LGCLTDKSEQDGEMRRELIERLGDGVMPKVMGGILGTRTDAGSPA